MKEAAGDEGGCRDGGTQEDKRIHLLDHRHWNFIISSYKVENAPIPPTPNPRLQGGMGCQHVECEDCMGHFPQAERLDQACPVRLTQRFRAQGSPHRWTAP